MYLTPDLSRSSRSFPLRRFAILPDADDLAQGRADVRARASARLRAGARTCVAASRTCVRSLPREKGFVFRFEYDSTARIFRDKRPISRFRFLYRRRLARIAYACLFAQPWIPADASRMPADASVWLDDTSVR